MSIYSTYATLADLAEYLDVDINSLADTSSRLLTRASELVAQLMFDNFVPTNANHVEAAKLATCSQVEYWQSVDESVAISGNVTEFSIDNTSMKFKDNGGQLCIRSRSYLNQQGLLYRGIKRSIKQE